MKHKVLGLFAVYGLYSAMGLFGIYLRAAELSATTAKPPAGTPAAVVVVPVPNGPIPPAGKQDDSVKQFMAIGQFGKFGSMGQIGMESGQLKVVAASRAVPKSPQVTEFVNPKVEPGKVKWHPDFDAACKAAAKSGKPVLLFQMMGQLDDQFC